MPNPFYCLCCGRKLPLGMRKTAKFCDSTCRLKYFREMRRNGSAGVTNSLEVLEEG